MAASNVFILIPAIKLQPAGNIGKFTQATYEGIHSLKEETQVLNVGLRKTNVERSPTLHASAHSTNYVLKPKSIVQVWPASVTIK
jgi:hypothetical protein